jgi:CRP/FNR family cyclic AMP-dependent transcriptional regulator
LIFLEIHPMDKIEKAKLLHTHYLFRDLKKATIDKIATMGTAQRFGGGETIFLKGEDGNALYGVLSGKVRISASAPNGRELILSILQTGAVFGEIALLDGRPRSADATTMGETALFVLQRREFAHFLEQDDKLAIHLMVMVCERLRSTNDLIEDVTFLKLPARLAKRLLTFAQHSVEASLDHATTEIRISQHELGLLLGTSRESINRLLQRWREDSLVKLGRGRITVLDPEALQQVVLSADDD